MKRIVLSTMVAAIALFLTMSSSSQAIVEEYQPDEHTWALYHFNEDFLDSSGNNRHLTVENPSGYIGFDDSWHPFLGRCLHMLKRYNDFHNQPRIKSSELRYPGTGSWTVEAQIYVPVENTTGATVARHYSEHWGGHDPYELSYFQNGEIVWAIQVGDDSWIISHPMTKGTWHQVAGVYDDNTMTSKLYLDGNLVDEISSPRPENLQAYNVYVGGSWFGPPGEVYLDELRISNIARTEFTVPGPATIEVAVDIDPDVLNLESRGRWITCYIWLPEPYDVADVDPDTILLNGQVSPAWSWIDEAEQMLMAKFPRSQTQEILEPGEVELTVTGELIDGTKFEGSDTIKVIDKGSGE